MKKWIFPMLFAGIFLGTLLVNFFGVDIVRQSGVFSNEYLIKINSVDLETNGLMRYITGARLKELALVVLLMMTPFSKIALKGMVFVWAFINGMLASICIIQQGVGGFLLFLLLSLPAYVIFYPGLFFLGGGIRASRGKGFLGCILFGILLTLCCSLFETYFFVNVIKKIPYTL